MANLAPRILIIDDNVEIHSDFRKILAPSQSSSRLRELDTQLFQGPAVEAETEYTLDFASQGAEALAMVKQAISERHPYAMAFVDVRMPPGWDGVQTIAEIRKVDSEMEFAICTAFSDYTSDKATEKLGLSKALLFIIKPFSPSTVRMIAGNLQPRAAVLSAA